MSPKVSMRNNIIDIAFILDNGFVIPTATAITSLIKNKHKDTIYRINLVTSNLSKENIDKFKLYENDNICINVIERDSNIYKDFHIFDDSQPCCASITALLKFELPSLLPNIDKVLYLDGDIIVRNDLSELFNNVIGDRYAAVVKDSGRMYYRLNVANDIENYFNSGVMLLNLKRLRQDNMTQKLLYAKKESKDKSLMDQNIFNIEFAGKVKFLDIKYNFLYLNLTRAKNQYTMEMLNKMFNSNYASLKEIEKKAYIIHFSSKDKPWKYSNIVGAKEWFNYYKKSYFYAPALLIQNQKKSIHDCLVDKKFIIFLRNIFSVYNSENKSHKIISILGIKIKLKRNLIKIQKDYEKFMMHQVKNNSVLITELNSYHGECLPGMTKYFLDLGYNIDILLNDKEAKLMPFSKYFNNKVTIFSASSETIESIFCSDIIAKYDYLYINSEDKFTGNLISANTKMNFKYPVKKILVMCHHAESYDDIDFNTRNIQVVSLADVPILKDKNYKRINTHFFKNLKQHKKNKKTKFIVVGNVQSYRKNHNLLISTVKELNQKGLKNFEIRIISRIGAIDIPQKLKKYFTFKKKWFE